MAREDRHKSMGHEAGRRRSVDGRAGSGRQNFGQENRGSKSPFAGESPMETAAPGERIDNAPRGPSLRKSSQNQSGGGEPRESVDEVSERDEERHTGRN